MLLVVCVLVGEVVGEVWCDCVGEEGCVFGIGDGVVFGDVVFE